MSKPAAAILYAPGTNCHEETAAALDAAGVRGSVVLLHDLLQGDAHLRRYKALVIPGGFSFGDHLGAGRVFAAILRARLGDQMAEIAAQGKPMLGICNGFQVLAEAGFLPGGDSGSMALLENQSARFEDRIVRLQVCGPESPWTSGLNGRVLTIPSAHGEGRALFCGSTAGRTVMRYAGASDKSAATYPENPSGTPNGSAGIVDEKGLILGLMPHPERASLPVHVSQDGLEIFKNLARML